MLFFLNLESMFESLNLFTETLAFFGRLMITTDRQICAIHSIPEEV